MGGVRGGFGLKCEVCSVEQKRCGDTKGPKDHLWEADETRWPKRKLGVDVDERQLVYKSPGKPSLARPLSLILFHSDFLF